MSGPLLTVGRSGASLAVGWRARRRARKWLARFARPASARSHLARRFLTGPSLLILGTDAVLAASPSSPVQLAHACMAAGFRAAIPASWGDELIAARVLDHLRDATGPRIQCICPFVDRRLGEHGDTIAPMLMRFVAPPVATAIYLRAAYGPSRPTITYAGACPAAADEAIDEWLTPDALLALIENHGIDLSAQPMEFDSVIPPDRRRHFSDPGGVPNRTALRQLSTAAELIEVHGDDVIVDIAQHLLSSRTAVIDPALALSCFCSGASASVAPEVARARVREHEPPRAASPVVDHVAHLDLAAPPVVRPARIPSPPEHERENAPVLASLPDAASRDSTEVEAATDPATIAAPAHGARRRSPPGQPRPVLGSVPLRRADVGRQLPRAFVARRRTSPRAGVRVPFTRTPASRWSKRVWWWVGTAAVALGLAATLLLRLGR